MTVLPVTRITLSATPSLRKAWRARSVGAKHRSATASVMTRFISSGNGFHLSKVRRPASTCPILIRVWCAAMAEAMTVVVSPCTSTQSGRSCTKVGSSRVSTRAMTWVGV